MTIRAQKNALLRLGTSAVERTRHPGDAQREPLLARIQVMELQRTYVPVISTNRAAAPGLGHENRFDLPSASRDRLLPAP